MAHPPGQTPNGEIMVRLGEVFCRLPGCGNRRVESVQSRLRDSKTPVSMTEVGHMLHSEVHWGYEETSQA
ncbi:hypothetical protein N7471_002231 [Penicillium samsonianum]|uniref:uncharacterized protein n=1 Tax=Penicillium samsonianum TaxID=1882272 RepID=UPI0025477AEC|nr:uncharacterized protein N7471_002231 [Penicillium samsonianum]KAJ6142778.1 hypothetical protein N7471_002231 [Penicillium samsonianum]